MCLAVPGRIEKIFDSSPRMAEVDFGGIKKEICVDFLPDIKEGEYVIVHVGYALEKINAREAAEQIGVFREAEEIINKKIK